MSLGRYPSEVRAIADEFIVLLEADYPNETAQIVATRGAAAFNSPSASEIDAATKFLGQSPSQRARKLKAMRPMEACTLILHARFIGLAAAQAMHFADRFEMVPGKSYREAAIFAAREVARARFVPDLGEVIPFSLNTRADGKALDYNEGQPWRFSDD